MRGKIALEEHVSTPENNRLWDSSGEAGRNGTEYMKMLNAACWIAAFSWKKWRSVILIM